MIVLGIESTAHTFGASVTKGDEVLSNARKLYSTESGGIIPNKVRDHHVECCGEIVQQALTDAKVSIKDIQLIAFSQAPGLGQTLRIGACMARSLALKHSIPLIGVNHCVAHLEIGRILTGAKDPILMYASGANTQIIAYEGGKYRVFGEALDGGIGNFLDTFGRTLGLGFPQGPKVEKLAKNSNTYLELPYSVKGMDVSFSGMLNKLKILHKEGKKPEDLAFSCQETVFAMLVEVTERALAHTGKEEVLLGGGVSCNKRLQEMTKKMCEERGAKTFILENQFNIDNAAMIALTGRQMFETGTRHPFDMPIDPYQRTDDVEVTWR